VTYAHHLKVFAMFYSAKIWSGEGVHQCLELDHVSKVVGFMHPWTGWKLTPMITGIV